MKNHTTARLSAVWLESSEDSCAVEPADSHAAASESHEPNRLRSDFPHIPVPGILGMPLLRRFGKELSDTAACESAAPGR